MYAPAVSGRHLEEKVTLKLIKTKTPGYVVQRLVDTLISPILAQNCLWEIWHTNSEFVGLALAMPFSIYISLFALFSRAFSSLEPDSADIWITLRQVALSIATDSHLSGSIPKFFSDTFRGPL